MRVYTKALFGNDPDTAYPLVSDRCKKGTSESEFAALSEQAHHDYGSLKMKTIRVDQLSGGGRWKWDACQGA